MGQIGILASSEQTNGRDSGASLTRLVAPPSPCGELADATFAARGKA
jgi:hypothetical protein